MTTVNATGTSKLASALHGLLQQCMDALLPIRRRSNRVRLASLLDLFVPVRPGRWVFVSRRGVPITGNLRAVLDEVVKQEKDVAIYCESPLDAAAVAAWRLAGARLLTGFSLRTLYSLLSSETVVVSHSVRDAYISRRKKGRCVINVWHGVALKRIEALMPGSTTRQHRQRMQLIRQNGRLYDAVLASNGIDRLVNVAAFGVPFDKVHAIGLPRFDYFRRDYAWPDDLAQASERLGRQLAGRKLLLYAPTFREHGTTLRELLSPASLAVILDFCDRHRLVFGVRPHPYQQAEFDRDFTRGNILDLSVGRYAETAVVLRQASYLVTDYSSLWVDYLYTRRPVFGYCPDMRRYTEKDRNFIYDYERLFPGPIEASWDAVLCHVEGTFAPSGLNDWRHRREEAMRLLLPSESTPSPISYQFINEVVPQVRQCSSSPYFIRGTP